MRKHNFLIYASLWVLILGASFYLQITEIKNFAQEIAYRQSSMLLESYNQLRQNFSRYQGLYAPVTDLVQPNPHIRLSDRDIKTADGKMLTLVAPHCINHDLVRVLPNTDGWRVRVVSLNPIKPEDMADAWESAALAAFAKGEKSREELFGNETDYYYRRMLPLQADAGCLKCHAAQGWQSGKTVGAISVTLPAEAMRKLTFSHLQRLETNYLLAGLAGLGVLLAANFSNKKMQRRLDKAKRHLQLAYLDVLTQLPNRRYYDFFVNREWKRAKRQIYPLSMIMIDIDYFKIYNDQYGHVQGDECLKQVAKTMRKFFRRAGDLIARYGGEEFCVVAACDADQAAQLAEILRRAVEDMKLPHPGSKISEYVTISLGTATVLPTESMDFEVLLRQADQTLYRAKENGRNRVESFGGTRFRSL